MEKTILFKLKETEPNIGFELECIDHLVDVQDSDVYCLIKDETKMYRKIYNQALEILGSKENLGNILTENEEDLLFGSEVEHAIIIPKVFINRDIKIHNKIISIKEKHIVKNHIPTKFVVSKKEPDTVNVNDSNIIIINFNFVSGKELSYVEARNKCETGNSFETNCLEFFNPDMLDLYCDVIVVKKDKSYISLKDLLANNDNRYISKHMRETHNTQKMLVSGAFEFKQAVDLFIKDEKSLFILHHHPLTLTDVKNTIVKVNNTNTDMSKFIINSVRNESSKFFTYGCNTNIYLSRKLLNKRLDYDDVNIIFTKEDIEKV